MIDSGWSRGDILTTWGIGVAVIGVAAALFSPQFQEWWNHRDEGEPSLFLNLSGAAPYEQVMPPGIARAAERTLAEITEALPEGGMEWLHEKDFGNSFRWSMIEFVEKFAWQPQVPARELLDRELERLRLNLVASAKDFVHLAASYTDDLHLGGDDDMRRIPDQYDEHGTYSDRLFFQKARELNDAAEKVWEAYQELVRRGRWKLAHSEATRENQ